MAEKQYKVSSYPIPSGDREFQRLLRTLSTEGGNHIITHIVIDRERPHAERQLIIVRLKE